MPERRAAVRSVHVEVAVEMWGGARRESVGAWVYDVEEGDWLPDRTSARGGCDKFFKVARILNRDSIRVEFPTGYFISKDGSAVVSRVRKRFTTATMDGGFDVTLRVSR